ncbi:Hypothetical predicted protein [Mytilus galloprovincialis]|uniref:Uncharacterized protein n=1 Tax=Mytilus galloprovincialis TaxID=29158 RepID=A0A8B6HQG4_MYTGA|nr:Hypothetical predicted protein [Mytilus galloprovincialis]
MSSKLRSIRAGHRSVISRLLKKFEDIRDDGDEPVNTEELTKIVNNLLKKQETLQKLNEDILENLDEGEVEAEIVDSDEYAYTLDGKITQIQKLILVNTSALSTNAKDFVSYSGPSHSALLNQLMPAHDQQSYAQPERYTKQNTYGYKRASMMNVMIATKTDEYDLEKFWKIESLATEKIDTTKLEEQIDIQKTYEEKQIRYHDNRYFVTLPWKEDHPTLPTNKAIAQRRTENVVRRLSKEPKLLEKYGEIMAEQEKRGFIEKVDTTNETDENEQNTLYSASCCEKRFNYNTNQGRIRLQL